MKLDLFKYFLLFIIICILSFIGVIILLRYIRRLNVDANIKSIDNQLENIDNEFILNVSSGTVPNHSVRNIFGQNSAQGTDFRAVWELSNTNDYEFPTSGLTMTVDSVLADNGVVIKIIGLNTDYEEISETITLNYNPAPVTTNQFFRINDVFTVSGNATQDITIQNGATTYAKINSGKGRNQASIFTVPKGYSFYLYRIDGFTADSTSQKPAKFRNKVNLPNGVVLRVAEVEFFNQMNIQRRLPFKYSEKTDITFQMAVFNGSHPCSVFGEGVLVKNN